MSGKDIEISGRSQDKQVAISSHGIEIRHMGKPVSSALAEAGYAYLVIDCSGSMTGDKLDFAKKGALAFAKNASSKGYSTGLICFSDSPSVLAEPTREMSMLERCLSRMAADGSTNMAAAIRLAHRHLGGKSGLRAMVIVTDGMPNSVRGSLKAGEDAKKDGIDIITIGTDDADQEFLKKLSSRTELGVKVSRERFEEGIASAAKMLPASVATKGTPSREKAE